MPHGTILADLSNWAAMHSPGCASMICHGPSMARHQVKHGVCTCWTRSAYRQLICLMQVGVQGPDAGGARYTLLGFVEHLGTMRSGHYVAYVQRGMNDSHSTHLQSLLRKHGLVPQSPPASQDSSSASPAHGKKQKKRSAAKAAAAAAGSDKAAGSSSTSEAGASEHHMAVARDAATPAFDAVATNGVAAEVDGNKAQSSSTVHMNGQTDHQQIVPDNWESDNGKSADKSQRDSSAGGPAVGQVHGDSQPTDTGIAEPDTVSDVGPAATLTLSSEGPVVGQPTPPAKEPDTAQVGSRQEAAASSLAEHQSVPGQRSWFYISDSQVKTVSEADILKREAYILLYMRTG